MKPPTFSLILLSLALSSPSPQAADPVGDLVLDETFDAPALVKGWLVQYGEWKPVDGVLRGRELPEDKHAAAARRLLPMEDGVFALRFRLTGPAAKGFHFGFDPAPGQLKKRGHLFSIIVTPDGAKLMKHVNKDNPKEDPNEILSESQTAVAPGVWHTLRVQKAGNRVEARIEAATGGSQMALAASHPTFHVKTPTLVFRCLGDGVEVDDIRVWVTPPPPNAANASVPGQ